MADAIDRAQAACEAHVADSLRRHKSQLAERRQGLTHCETLDCREPIEPARTALGARLCEDCQREEDIRAAQYAQGRGW